MAAAQNAQLSGYVRDPSQAVVPDATVTATHLTTGVGHSSRANKQGLYTLLSLPPGQYKLVAEATGFEPAIIDAVQLEVAQDARLDLTVNLPGLAERVSVQNETRLLGSRDGSVGTVVDRRFADRIPLNGRTFQPLLELAPGVIATGNGFAVNGQRTDANTFMVDGVSANVGTSSATNMISQAFGQTVGTNVIGGLTPLTSPEGLSEFRTQTSTFSPEFGRTPGAQISIVTRSGTNELHGSAYEHFRDEALDATGWFLNSRGLDKPEMRQHAFGGSAGGPIVRSHLFYFGSYEGLRLKQPRTTTRSVPSLELRAAAAPALRPIMDAFPVPSGPGTTTGLAEYVLNTSEPVASNMYSVRIDGATGRGTQVFGRFARTPSRREVEETTSVDPIDLTFTTGTIGVTSALSPQTLVEFRANATENRGSQTSRPIARDGAILPPDTIFPDLAGGDSLVGYLVGTTATVGRGVSADNHQRQVNVLGAVTVARGAHQLKAGIDWRRVESTLRPRALDVLAIISSIQEAAAGRAGLLRTRRNLPFDASVNNVAVYVQDAWRPGPRLSLTYGVRWDVTPAPSFNGVTPYGALGTNPDTLDIERTDRLWTTNYRGVQPRLGFAYSLDSAGTTVLSGGVGLFTDLGTQGAARLFQSGILGTQYQQILTNVPVPLDGSQVPDPSVTELVPPYRGIISLVDPTLAPPTTTQWNVKVERQFGGAHEATVAYVGADGRDLLVSDTFFAPNPNFAGRVDLIRNAGRSRYDSLQAQYRVRSWAGLQVLTSYTLGWARDNGSSYLAARIPDAFPSDEWGPADFDIRHSWTGAISWESRLHSTNALGRAVSGWQLDTLFRARSGAPLNIITGRDPLGVGSITYERPNLVAGQQIWIDDASAPGGRRLNPAAFESPAGGVQGTLGRNAVWGLNALQVDLSVRREVGLPGRSRLEFMIFFYNLFNRVNFGYIGANLREPGFGVASTTVNAQLSATGATGELNSLYQWGGPRSIELGLRFKF